MQTVVESLDRTLGAAFAATAAGAWADALRLAGSVIARDPLHSGAHEVISTARRALESARDAEAERRQITILFADVAGSTGILNRLGGEAYREFMLEVHQIAAKAISRFGGRIGQYLGDGILAYFSYPQAYEDDAQRAVYAALTLIDNVKAASPHLGARFGSGSSLRVGIDTGRVVVGAAGAGAWTTVDSVFGDATHLAARLQVLAPPDSVLISDATRQLVERHFTLEALEPRTLKDYPQPIAAYRVVAAGVESATSASSPMLIDRDVEVGNLERQWASAHSGQGTELLLSGEAGVGKSRLVEHLANVAIATGGRVVTIQCLQAFQHTALYPVARALRRLLTSSTQQALDWDAARDFLTEAGVSEALVARALDPLASLVDEGRSSELLPEPLRATLFELITQLFHQLASRRPLLLIVEDLHRADASTEQLLNAIRNNRANGTMILATQRDDGAEMGWEQTLRLEPLAATFARALALRSAPQLTESQLETVLRASAGLPLFLVDAARGVASGSSALAVPSATTALLTHRLDQLDDDARALIADLSVLGTGASYRLLSGISELPAERLERALARALFAELIVAHSTDEGSVFQFRHQLDQELAYDRQLRAARTRRHSRCADALIASTSSRHGSLPELIAHHLVNANRAEESVQYWQQAGERAAAAAAHHEALSHYERGLNALASTPAGPERAPLELVLQLCYAGSCSALHGYADGRSMEAYTRAAEIAANTPNASTPLPALWGIWAAYLVRGAHREGLALVQRCLALADASDSKELRAVAAAISGTQYAYVGRWADAQAELELAIEATGPATLMFPQNPALASRALLAVVCWVRGDEQAAARHLQLALDELENLSGRQADFTRAYVLSFAAWYAVLQQDPERALAFAQQALAIAQRNNFVTWIGAGALHIASALSELGDFENALPTFERALAGWRGAGSELMVPYFLARSGWALVRSGNVEQGVSTLREALTVGAATGEEFYQAEIHRLLAEALVLAGAPRAAVRAELDAAVRIADQQGALAFGARARKALTGVAS